MLTPIPELHDAMLHNVTATRHGESLPQKVVDRYWQYKRLFDRVSTNLTPADFARIALDCECGGEVAADTKTPSLFELWKAKKVKNGAVLTIQWHGEKRNGVLVRANPDKTCIVKLDGEVQEHTIPAEQVAVAA